MIAIIDQKRGNGLKMCGAGDEPFHPFPVPGDDGYMVPFSHEPKRHVG